ncbi:phage terminase small subunit [Parablautia sp. Marseille-Q6255]|uniref:phage terminase small subunit n=1 Tax=Parablautia sp. Marseille-Q6255 TaxID=3039593 RepID=UPI0024BD489D|nr:phage terminase small subunit [Parablautia sp. Marseille-Q6255]
MARARSPNSIEAEEMYKSGMKLVEIAKRLNVPASTVRRWKSTQEWDGKTEGKKSERSQKKKTNARHKGGQPGNKNAVGNKGGPLKPGDRIAEKHGAYSSVYWDVLDESEKEMIEEIQMDEELLLIEQIQLFAVRERRIMLAINKYRNMKGDVSLYGFDRSETKRTFKTDEDKQLYEERIEKKISAEERLPGDSYSLVTNMENKDNMIARLEKELSTVQSKKTKAIETLARLRLEKQKIDGESKGNELVQVWAEKVKKMRMKCDE